jgi:prepilin-type N-terminal cleavage/methylation domain-containing protein
MELNKKGFTLIELLVVVLIIGILAAIALPQYRLAVNKSKTAQILSLIKNIGQAQQIYYLTNDKYAEKFEDLDITLPKDATSCGYDGYYATDCKNIGSWKLTMSHESYYGGMYNAYPPDQKLLPWIRFTNQLVNGQKGLGCYVPKDTVADKICQLLGGRLTYTGEGSKVYALN